jgi:hypothetical protein
VYESIFDKLETLAYDPKGNYVLIAVMQILKAQETKDMLNSIIDRLIPQIPLLIKD